MKLLFLSFDRLRNRGINALPPIKPDGALPSRASGNGRHNVDAIHLVNQIMAHHAARIAKLRIQQQARTFQRSCREHDNFCLHMHFAMRMPVDKMHSIGKTGVLVDADFANDRVFDRYRVCR